MPKPHRGRLERWEKRTALSGHFYTGVFIGHPEFHLGYGHTSLVISEDGNEIETLNSRYTLGEKRPPWQEERKAPECGDPMVTAKSPLGTPDEV